MKTFRNAARLAATLLSMALPLQAALAAPGSTPGRDTGLDDPRWSVSRLSSTGRRRLPQSPSLASA